MHERMQNCKIHDLLGGNLVYPSQQERNFALVSGSMSWAESLMMAPPFLTLLESVWSEPV